MTKRSKSGFLNLTHAQRQSLATWVFGSLLLIFFVCVFAFAPEKLPVFKQRMLAISSALLAGLFAFFFTGKVGLNITSIQTRFGEFGVKASGGIAVFMFVLLWWLSPWAPVDVEEIKELKKKVGKVEIRVEKVERELAISIATSPGCGIPTPSSRARKLAAQISADADAYDRAIKATIENDLGKARKLLDEAEGAGQSADRARIYTARGRIELLAGQYDKAADWFQCALSLVPDNPDTLNETSVALIYGGRFEEALPHLQKAVNIWSKLFGAENADVGRGLSNLAAVYHHLGKLYEAETNYLGARLILEKRPDKDSTDLAICLNNLASVYQDKREFSKAKQLYHEVVSMLQDRDADNPCLAVIYINQADFWKTQGQIEGIESLYKRALEIQENARGKESLDLATTLNNLGAWNRDRGEFEKSQQYYDRALKIRTNALGPSDPVVAESLNNIADLQMKQDHFGQAAPLLKRALEICRTNHRTNDWNASIYFKNLGTVYRELGQSRFEEAQMNYRTALAIRTNLFGQTHPSVATSLHDLAVLYTKWGRTEDAIQYLRQKALVLEHLPERDDAAVSRNREELAFLESTRTNSAEVRKRSTDD